MKDKGKLVWKGDLLDGSHAAFYEKDGHLLKFDRVFDSRTGRPKIDGQQDVNFKEDIRTSLIYQILKKLSKVENDYSASLWESDRT